MSDLVLAAVLCAVYAVGYWSGWAARSERRPGGYGQFDPEAEAELDAAKRKARPR